MVLCYDMFVYEAAAGLSRDSCGHYWLCLGFCYIRLFDVGFLVWYVCLGCDGITSALFTLHWYRKLSVLLGMPCRCLHCCKVFATDWYFGTANIHNLWWWSHTGLLSIVHCRHIAVIFGATHEIHVVRECKSDRCFSIIIVMLCALSYHI